MNKTGPLPKISDAEYEIMKIIWKNKKMTAYEVIEKIDPKFNWNDKTIKTMLNRLLKKHVIDYEKQGKHYIYYPIIKEEEYRVVETKSFIKKIFNGSLNTLVASFLKEAKLSSEEIDELKKILEEKEEE
ncbi:BlaI/MecI/CopY family transcriptional regulator [Crassaminicella profunda]|uniref:BlaI/MecI/CopY family transcriptional regulator n=1 Tax=Crassaminicella profunda TaxID=1286698 RepID=UPI001CA73368|nr:BlaI/MecI/CopY family transcriptional regulator [Crassaminicella profunda]QZY56922.1 BlaI/MecI/CopY family transcriptional regulator [Crassaminicella profunda]